MAYIPVNTIPEWKAKVAEVIFENNTQEITPTLHKALLRNLADLLIALMPATGVTSVDTGMGLTGGEITSQGTISLDINWMLDNFATYLHTHAISDISGLQDILDAFSNSIPETTDELPEGDFNLYFTIARVLASQLIGLDLSNGSVITENDSILIALGKLQAQITQGNWITEWDVQNTPREFIAGQGHKVKTILSDSNTLKIDLHDGNKFFHSLVDDTKLLIPTNHRNQTVEILFYNMGGKILTFDSAYNVLGVKPPKQSGKWFLVTISYWGATGNPWLIVNAVAVDQDGESIGGTKALKIAMLK